MKWVAEVLVEARVGARVGVVSLSLVSGTIYRASFLSKIPSLRVGQDSEIGWGCASAAAVAARDSNPESRTCIGGRLDIWVGWAPTLGGLL